MTTQVAPICMWCKRYRRRGPDTPGRQCEAFPDEIPEVVWSAESDHRKPIAGDHGLQYAQGPTEPPDHWKEPS